jgi:RNA polymerase-associated protein LEO1
MRLPNFVKIDSKPFHPDTYIGPEHDDEDAQQIENIREKSMTIKLKVENTVRWRWTKDESGQDASISLVSPLSIKAHQLTQRRQSNSRVIRWSDGSSSLRLGKELFDITENRDTSAGVPRQHIGPHSSQPPVSQSQPDGSSNRSQGLTYLVAQHKRSQVLQAESVITGYMTLRPTGMQSDTHRMLVRAVGQKHNKVARLRMAPDPTMDPEREKMELMKQNAKKSRRKNDQDDGLGGGRKRRHSRKTSSRDMMWSDDEGDDAVGVYAASDEEDDGTGVGSSGRKSKRRATDESKGPEDYQEDDFVVPDSSDEEAGTRGARKDMMEEDPLDRIDAKIEQQDAQKRRRESGGKGSDDKEPGAEEGRGDAMDIESEEEEEEEEEELKVRKIGGTGTRKRAAVFDDEDDDE